MEKYILLLASILAMLGCRNKNVEKKESPDVDCLISSYVTDTTDNAYAYKLKYDGNRIIEIRTTYKDFFNTQVESVNTVAYNSDGNPSTISNTSSNTFHTKFFYNTNGVLASRVTYRQALFPTSKVDFEWTGNKISKIKSSDFEIKGSPNALENYTERLNYILDLKYDEKGNVVYVKRTTSPDMLVTEMTYAYDDHPNPLKNFSLLRNSFISYDGMYLLSTNNMTRVKYNFVKEEFVVDYDSHYEYNENGYPKNGSFNNRLLDIRYLCE